MNLNFLSHSITPNYHPASETDPTQWIVTFSLGTSNRDAAKPILSRADALVADFHKKFSSLEPTPAQIRLRDFSKQLADTRADAVKNEADVKDATATLETLWRAGKDATGAEATLARHEASRTILTKKIKFLEDAVAVAEKESADEGAARDRVEREKTLVEWNTRAEKLKKKIEAAVNEVVVELSAISRATNTLL